MALTRDPGPVSNIVNELLYGLTQRPRPGKSLVKCRVKNRPLLKQDMGESITMEMPLAN